MGAMHLTSHHYAVHEHQTYGNGNDQRNPFIQNIALRARSYFSEKLHRNGI